MALQKKDFIEIEFVAKIKDSGEVFDSNIEDELKKIPNSNLKLAKPFIYCLGEGMFLEGVDNYLFGKELGKYKIELKPEEAFGNRNPSLIKMIPKKVFILHKINPVQGAVLNFDGKMGRVLSVSGGRILVDFNHPLAGKEVVYDVNIRRKIENIEEKLKAFNNFLFKQDLKFEIKDKKITYNVDSKLKAFIEMFKDKFKEIFGLDLEIKIDNKEKPKEENGDKNKE